MSANFAALAYLVASVLFIMALRGLSSPETSRRGNFLGMAGMTIAIVTTVAMPAESYPRYSRRLRPSSRQSAAFSRPMTPMIPHMLKVYPKYTDCHHPAGRGVSNTGPSEHVRGRQVKISR